MPATRGERRRIIKLRLELFFSLFCLRAKGVGLLLVGEMRSDLSILSLSSAAAAAAAAAAILLIVLSLLANKVTQSVGQQSRYYI